MRLQSITVSGHTSIRHAEVRLGDINVLVGANGAGKSNFIKVLELLGRIVDEDLQFYVNGSGGASALLHQPSGAELIEVKVTTEQNVYGASLSPTSGDQLVFADEWTTFTPIGKQPRERLLGRGHLETRLHEVAAEKETRTIADHVVELLRGCRVYHFHDTSHHASVKTPHPTADNLALQADAANLAPVLLRLRDAEPATYRRIVGAVQLVAPFFRDFVLQPDHTDRVRLAWRQYGTDTVFSAHQMSDGTLRFVCLATLLLGPGLPELIVLDEPELGLHPYAIAQLAGLLRGTSGAGGQVVLATQSVTLINEFDLEEVIVVEHDQGASTFERPSRDHLRAWLEEYSLGELWQKNLIGGRPQHGVERVEC